jgi:hypothetical protein
MANLFLNNNQNALESLGTEFPDTFFIPANLNRNQGRRTLLNVGQFLNERPNNSINVKEWIVDKFQSANVTNAQLTGAVADLDAAAATGVAIYAVVDANGLFGHIQFVSPTNASTTFLVGASGPVVRAVDNNDAATNGTQIYFDEDAANTDERFLINNTITGKDLFIPTTDGQVIRLKHNATPGTPGVAVYLDEDAASAHLKLLFVSPTNTAGSYTTDNTVSLRTNVAVDSLLAALVASELMAEA